MDGSPFLIRFVKVRRYYGKQGRSFFRTYSRCGEGFGSLYQVWYRRCTNVYVYVMIVGVNLREGFFGGYERIYLVTMILFGLSSV